MTAPHAAPRRAPSVDPAPTPRRIRRSLANLRDAVPLADPDLVSLVVDLDATAWQVHAECAKPQFRKFMDDFFAEERSSHGRALVQRAKTLCEGCVVRADCLEYAQREGINHGVYGGLTASERSRRSETPVLSNRPRKSRGSGSHVSPEERIERARQRMLAEIHARRDSDTAA
jgi:WhiB family transcriptional regulator, redox-sensing transcriptional regulator